MIIMIIMIGSVATSRMALNVVADVRIPDDFKFFFTVSTNIIVLAHAQNLIERTKTRTTAEKQQEVSHCNFYYFSEDFKQEEFIDFEVRHSATQC